MKCIGKEQEHNALVTYRPSATNAHCLGWVQCNQNVVGFRFRNIDVTNHWEMKSLQVVVMQTNCG